jgi:hypothetical protein
MGRSANNGMNRSTHTNMNMNMNINSGKSGMGMGMGMGMGKNMSKNTGRNNKNNNNNKNMNMNMNMNMGNGLSRSGNAQGISIHNVGMSHKGVVSEDTPPNSPGRDGNSSQLLSPFERINCMNRTPNKSQSGQRGAQSGNNQSIKFPDGPVIVHVDPNEIYNWPFPIDLVYTWVNGSDRNWSAKKQQWLSQTQMTEERERLTVDSAAECRWQHFDELRHSIDSVNYFAPWIRTIWIISDNQIPPWYNAHNSGKVRIIDHQTLFGQGGFEQDLPTFNSHAIEAHLHRIPELSEHFIYANDDMFMGNFTSPSDFFSTQGHVKVYLGGTPLNQLSVKNVPSVNFNEVSLHSFSQGVVSDLLDECFGMNANRLCLRHQMKALTKSIIETCWEHDLLKDFLTQTSATRFRAVGDIECLSLFCWVGIETGVALESDISSKYYPLQADTEIRKLFHHLANWKPPPKLYCINNCLEHCTPAQGQQIVEGLETSLPHQYISQMM